MSIANISNGEGASSVRAKLNAIKDLAEDTTAKLLPKPKTIVILGSSNAAGMGATGYTADPVAPFTTEPGNSWAGRLRSALTGWTIYNRSISGTSTRTGLNNSVGRFWTDVAPYRPSHVILATALHNDSYNVDEFIRGLMELIGLCDLIGAIPVVRGPSPLNGATATQFSAMLEAQRQIDLLGVWQIDALSTLIDPANGGFIGGATYHVGDGLHPNDAGYEAQFSAIDIEAFTAGYRPNTETKPRGAWLCPLANANPDQILINTPRALKSWTARARIKEPSVGGSAIAAFSAFIHGNANAPMRLRQPSYIWGIIQGDAAAGVTAFTTPADAGRVRDHVIVFRRETGVMSYFVDGVLIGSFSPGGTGGVNDCNKFIFGSRENGFPAQGFTYEDCQLWSLPLTPTQVADMARTLVAPRAGLLYDLVMAHECRPTSSGGRIPNFIRNGLVATSGQKWDVAPPLVKNPVFVPVTLQNGWVTRTGAAYAPAGFYISDDGMVTLQGHIAGGTTTAGTLLFTLPLGARPLSLHMFPVLNNGTPGNSIQVWPDGSVFIVGTANATGTCFDGLTFKAR